MFLVVCQLLVIPTAYPNIMILSMLYFTSNIHTHCDQVHIPLPGNLDFFSVNCCVTLSIFSLFLDLDCIEGDPINIFRMYLKMICLCLLVLYLYIHVCQHMSYQLILYDLLIFLCYCRHFVSDRLSDYGESRDQVQGAYVLNDLVVRLNSVTTSSLPKFRSSFLVMYVI